MNVTDSEEVEEFDKDDMSPTRLPNYVNVTWWNKANYKQRPTRKLEATTSTTETRTVTVAATTAGLNYTTTSYFISTGYDSGFDRPNTILDAERPVSIALTATLASLGCIVLLLIGLITYFGYFR